MPFKKGQSGNPKGKPKGAKGIVTAQAREMFIGIMEGELDHVQEHLEALRRESSRDYLKCLAAFLPYFIPKQAETEVKIIGPHKEPSWFAEVLENNPQEKSNLV